MVSEGKLRADTGIIIAASWSIGYHGKILHVNLNDSSYEIEKPSEQLGIHEYEVNLVFINGVPANLVSSIEGGERVVLYPPLGGG